MQNRISDFSRSKGFRYLAISLAAMMVLTFFGLAAAQRLKPTIPPAPPDDPLIEQLDRSPDLPLAIEQDEDTPMKILAASVKEIPGSLYEKLVSERQSGPSAISVPEVRMVNLSDKTVTHVMLIIEDPGSQRSKGLVFKELAIAPGQEFTVSRESFVRHEHLTGVDEAGRIAAVGSAPQKDKRFWLPFNDRTRLKVRIAVTFADGSKWFNRNQGGEK